MKHLAWVCLLVLFHASALWSQRTDPNSTPPGAPIVAHGMSDALHRAAPYHPGNAGERIAAANVTIIESQSYNSGHQMDAVWSSVVTSMGHTPTIAPQSTLNSTAFFASTNALIVSSGVISLSAAQITTIRQFLQTGKSVYLQGEYLPSYTTNIGFRDIVVAMGGTFTLGSTVSGSLVPTNALNLYATTPNAVAPLSYHWYGCTGSGCNNIEYFMNYAGNNLGFVYCPTTVAWGDLIQNTDQDWINQSTSLPLMRNILYALLSGNACSFVCGILDASQLQVMASPGEEGTVHLSWSADGDLPHGRFEVLANGQSLATMDAQPFAGELYTYEDVRLPAGVQRYTVRFVDDNGQTSVQGETEIDLGVQPARLRVAQVPAGFRVWLGEGHTCKSLALVDATGRVESLPTADMATGQMIDMAQHAPGAYILRGETMLGQRFSRKLVWMP